MQIQSIYTSFLRDRVAIETVTTLNMLVVCMVCVFSLAYLDEEEEEEAP